MKSRESAKTGRPRMSTRRRALIVLGGAAAVAAGAGVAWRAGLAPLATARADEVTVYKSPYCGCCGNWIEHMRAGGFAVKVREVEDVGPIKARYGVPPALESCHTAIVDGYVIEGHVPADVIKRLLAERPDARGIAVPGMPAGSPGMDGAGREPYDVVIFDRSGGTAVYARW